MFHHCEILRKLLFWWQWRRRRWWYFNFCLYFFIFVLLMLHSVFRFYLVSFFVSFFNFLALCLFISKFRCNTYFNFCLYLFLFYYCFIPFHVFYLLGFFSHFSRILSFLSPCLDATLAVFVLVVFWNGWLATECTFWCSLRYKKLAAVILKAFCWISGLTMTWYNRWIKQE